MTTGNLTIYKGQDYSFPVTITNSDGSILDVTSATFTAPISRFENAPVSENFTITKTAPTSGIITLSLNSGETAGLPWAGAFWNLWMLNSGVREAVIKGEIGIEGGLG